MNYQYNYSIIIPHYSIPELLTRCIKSIPEREDIQIIVVDDCSPCQEQTFQMLDGLKRPYLEWYSTSIGGSAGRARNIGLDHAKGKWLIFMDADDLFSENASVIFDNSIGHTENILFYNIKAVMNDNLNIVSKRNFYSNYFEHCDDNSYDDQFKYFFHSLWGKIFNHEFIKRNGVRFDNTRYSNDAFFSFYAGVCARSVFKSKEVLYVVTERDGSLASSQMKKRIISKEECTVRLSVALKIYKLKEREKIALPINDVFNYLDKLRAHYKSYYLTCILPKLIFTNPNIAFVELKKNLRSILSRFK